MNDLVSRKRVLDSIHASIYEFFDVCGDDEEIPMSEKDKLLLEVNKKICNRIKDLPSTQYPIEEKISKAKATNWLTQGLTKNEIKTAIEDAKADAQIARHMINLERDYMNDLISREKLLKKIDKVRFDAEQELNNGTLCVSPGIFKGINIAIEIINEMEPEETSHGDIVLNKNEAKGFLHDLFNSEFPCLDWNDNYTKNETDDGVTYHFDEEVDL